MWPLPTTWLSSPPELLRKGRWDELFFVDLPNAIEREAIWRIQIARRGRNPATFDLTALVDVTAGFTGAEIEQIFIDALYEAFAEGSEPDTAAVERAVVPCAPLVPINA